jgi:hypothetical protein
MFYFGMVSNMFSFVSNSCLVKHCHLVGGDNFKQHLEEDGDFVCNEMED